MPTQTKTKKNKKNTAAKEKKYTSRPLWRGFISFGLINIPIMLFSAQKTTSTRFHMLDKRNMSRIRYQRINEKNNKIVPWSDIVKGYEFEKDNYVVLTDDELEKAAPEDTKTISIENFINKTELESLYYETPYFLVPSKGGEKGYALLEDVMEETGKIGIAKIVIHGHQYLSALIPYDKGMVLNILRFSDELRETTDYFNFTPSKVTTKEKQIAKQLIDALSVDWEPETYHDDFQETITKIIKNKVKTGKVKEVTQEKPETTAKSNVVDFMSLLKKSIKTIDNKSVIKRKAG